MTASEQGIIERSTPKDSWREAILAERERERIHRPMLKALSLITRQKRDALILGDASLVQACYLIEGEGFEHVVDVDSSPTLLDDYWSHEKLEKVLSAFENYQPSENSFDFIYSKSIGFYPKETILDFLKQLKVALRNEGIFAAEWGGEKDEFRKNYSVSEIQALYEAAGFEIIWQKEIGPKEYSGLVKPGIGHSISVIAKPRTTNYQ